MSSWDGKAYNENGEPLMTGTQYRDECAADALSQIDAREYDNEHQGYPEPPWWWESVYDMFSEAGVDHSHLMDEILKLVERLVKENDELRRVKA